VVPRGSAASLPLIAVAFAAPGDASARSFECTRSDRYCFVSVHWTQRTIPYVLRRPAASKYDETIATATVESAMSNWEETTCSDVAFARVAVELPNDPDASTTNDVVFVDEGWADQGFASNAAGVTQVAYNTATGEIVRAALFLNEEITEVLTSTDTCTGLFDLEAVLTHELGHYLGFAHPCEYHAELEEPPACPTAECPPRGELMFTRENPKPTMWPEIDPCDMDLRFVTKGDLDGLCSVYPNASSARQCYDMPDVDDPVGNDAFGCACSAAHPRRLSPHARTALVVLWLGLLVGVTARARRATRPACSRAPHA
jgi:hypothetical protein